MNYNDTSYDLSDPEPQGKKKRKKHGSVLKVWLLEGVPRYLLIFAIVWLVVLFHTMFTEAAEFRAVIRSSSGNRAFMKVPGAQSKNPEYLWTSPYNDRVVLPEDEFRTGLDSTITIGFVEGSQVRVNPSSLLRLGESKFDRSDGARRRGFVLNGGSLYVRTTTPLGPTSEFTIKVSQANVTGWNAFYYVDPSRLEVSQGTVTAVGHGKTVEVPAGQGLDFGSMSLRPIGQQATQGLSQAANRLPAPATPDKARGFVVDLEQKIVLAHSSALLNLIRHKPGTGNPFKEFSLVNSSRRTQCERRLMDLHVAMQSLNNAPAAIRLDDFGALGVSKDRLHFLRQAFYRGQLMSYQGAGNTWRVTARGTDREHTLIMMNQNGVAGKKKEGAE